MPVAQRVFFASLTHELEHDLIHSMYFRKQRVPHNLMMGLVWLARPSTINPWIRRHLHLNHHKVSGTEADMEERAITNGEPWGIARLLMVGDNVMSAFIRMLRAKTRAHKFSIIKRFSEGLRTAGAGALGGMVCVSRFFTPPTALRICWVRLSSGRRLCWR